MGATGWERVLSRVGPLVGTSDPTGRYTLEEIGAKRLRFARENGKTFTVAATLCNRVWSQVEAGQRLEKQANGPKGGISYTVAISVSCAWALGLELGSDGRWGLPE